MIGFIDLKGQIYLDDEPCFAFYNTVTDEFISFGNEEIWGTWGEFETSFNDYREDFYDQTIKITRFKALVPGDYFKEKP